MKRKLLRLLLLPAIMCTLLAVGSFTTAGAAHAATLQRHVSVSPASYRTSCGTDDPVTIYTDYNPDTGLSDIVCFGGYGSQNVNLYNVQALYTGYYILYFNWHDCNGNVHYSAKAPHTWVTAANSPGLYAGFYVMCDITYIDLEPPPGV